MTSCLHVNDSLSSSIFESYVTVAAVQCRPPFIDEEVALFPSQAVKSFPCFTIDDTHAEHLYTHMKSTDEHSAGVKRIVFGPHLAESCTASVDIDCEQQLGDELSS